MLLAIHPGLLIILYTLPETNSSPLKKWWLGDDSFLLERSTFKGETLVSGRVPPNILPKILSLGSPTTLDGWAYHPDEMKRRFFQIRRDTAQSCCGGSETLLSSSKESVASCHMHIISIYIIYLVYII